MTDRDTQVPGLVCVHGLGGSALTFGALTPLLVPDPARSRPVLTPDLPGHGRAPADTPTPAGVLAGYVGTVDRLIRAEAAGPVLLIGHSMGGVVALLQAIEHPENIAALVLLSVPSPDRRRNRVDLRQLAKVALLRTGMRRTGGRPVIGEPAAAVRNQLGGATPSPERVPAELVAATVAETAWRAARPDAAAADQQQRRADLEISALLARPVRWRRRVAGIGVPVLWLHGEDDPLVDARDASAFARVLGARYESRPGVGHLPQAEDAPWVADRIRSWSATILGTAQLPDASHS